MGRDVRLSATQYRLLSYLAAPADRVAAPAQVLEHVWGPGYGAETEYVKSYVSGWRSGWVGALWRRARPDQGTVTKGLVGGTGRSGPRNWSKPANPLVTRPKAS